jgi:hypothetical protein
MSDSKTFKAGINQKDMSEDMGDLEDFLEENAKFLEAVRKGLESMQRKSVLQEFLEARKYRFFCNINSGLADEEIKEDMLMYGDYQDVVITWAYDSLARRKKNLRAIYVKDKTDYFNDFWDSS